MKKSSVLPDNVLRCMSPSDRRSLGQMTQEECIRKAEVKSERQLQNAVVGLLRLRGIEPLVPTFGKKTRISEGWPDITFAAYGIPCVWEVKLPHGKLSTEQHQMAVRLLSHPNSWRWRVIRSVDDAISELKELETAL